MKKINERHNILYSNPLPSTRTGSLYNAFPYPTKISPETIAIFIACHTNVGETILDTFGGSGTTGLATLLCDIPTPEMITLAKNLGLSPKWGPRKAIIYEIGVLGTFISETMCNPPDVDLFRKSALKLIDEVERKLNIYETIDPQGNIGHIRHVIWSDYVICPNCKKEYKFWDVAVKKSPATEILKQFICPNCTKTSNIDSLQKVVEKYTNGITNKRIERKKRIPVRIYGSTKRMNWVREVSDFDIKQLKAIEKITIPDCVPLNEVEWGDLYRSGYHHGVNHIYDFYTKRNLLVIANLWQSIASYPKSIQPALKFLVLSYNASHATLMSRVVIKNGSKDFVLTGAQSGVLYISSLPIEKNIFEGLKRKLKTITEAFASVKTSGSKVEVVNKSSVKLNIKDKSIDYVFTDPPFGDYIPYAEINQINEAWLGQQTNRKEEIIISPAQNKTVVQYAELMKKVFGEIGRVLKDTGNATVVFHSAKANVWQALTNAIISSHLTVTNSSILDKVQTSFKQTNSADSVKGDPLLLLEKRGEIKKVHTVNSEKLIDDIIYKAMNGHIVKVAERHADRLYSRYCSKCMELNIPITINADSFYDYVRSKEGVL